MKITVRFLSLIVSCLLVSNALFSAEAKRDVLGSNKNQQEAAKQLDSQTQDLQKQARILREAVLGARALRAQEKKPAVAGAEAVKSGKLRRGDMASVAPKSLWEWLGIPDVENEQEEAEPLSKGDICRAIMGTAFAAAAQGLLNNLMGRKYGDFVNESYWSKNLPHRERLTAMVALAVPMKGAGSFWPFLLSSGVQVLCEMVPLGGYPGGWRNAAFNMRGMYALLHIVNWLGAQNQKKNASKKMQGNR